MTPTSWRSSPPVFDRFRAAVAQVLTGNRKVASDRRNGLNYFSIGPAIAGVRLHEPEDALKLATVWRCVNIISETIAALPWGVFQRESEQKTNALHDHRVTWMLRHEANPEQTAFVAKRTYVSHILLGGNGYAEIERDAIGRAVNLWPLHFSRVCAERTVEDGRLVFGVQQGGGGKVLLEARDVFHVPGFSTDGVQGYSVLEMARQSLSTGLALDQFAGRYFNNGMQLSGIITTPEKMGDDARTNLLGFLERFVGSRNAFKVLPLDGGMDFKPISSTPEQGQFLDARKFSVLDVCRWFGVPPHMAFDLDRATFSNIESQSIDFLRYGLLPRILPMEQEADRKLLTSRRGGLFTKMNVNGLLRADSAQRIAFYRGMKDMGALNVNEIRALEDLDGIGTAGDVYQTSVQYQKPDGAAGAPENPPPEDPPPATGRKKPGPNGAIVQ